MRESNYSFPAQNRAVVGLSQLIYDRRALDTNSDLATLNNLTSLTYLTSTSPRIREILTTDGGLERILDILRCSILPQERNDKVQDLWGLNGPVTARIISIERARSLKHSLAFQSLVNVGVRGTEAIRTRVVQAGALDIVAQILETWLIFHEIAIIAHPLGSQAAVNATRENRPVPGTFPSRTVGAPKSRSHAAAILRDIQSAQAGSPGPAPLVAEVHQRRPTPDSPPVRRQGGMLQLMADLVSRNVQRRTHTFTQPLQPIPTPADDVDMADAEYTDGASIGGADEDEASILEAAEERMELDEAAQIAETPLAGPSRNPMERVAQTPRARRDVLPITTDSIASSSSVSPVNVPQPPAIDTDPPSRGSSVGNSASDAELADHSRNASGVSLVSDDGGQTTARPRPNLTLPHLNTEDAVSSNASSPMGTPRVQVIPTIPGATLPGRRGTLVGRHNLALPPRTGRNRDNTGSGTSDDGREDVDMDAVPLVQTATMAGRARTGTLVADATAGMDIQIVDNFEVEPLDTAEEVLQAEQARQDLEAGAPPGQPGAPDQTPVVTITQPDGTVAPTEPTAGATVTAVANQQQAQIIVANGAPRGFQDLNSYVGISSLLNPDSDCYSEDSILLALQLLAYLSKYPQVRRAFHHPRRAMHPKFDLGNDDFVEYLPERPSFSRMPNLFSLVERFTFRPSPSDPLMYRIPPEIQYWAGVIMRNACRKDDAQGGIRQCAHMSCGKWERFPREFAKCRRCRKAKYCSKECQSKAWSEGHRFWCSQREETLGATPGDDAERAVGGGAPGTGDTNGGADTDGAGDVPDGPAAGGARARHHRHHEGHQPRRTEAEEAEREALRERRRREVQEMLELERRAAREEREIAQRRQALGQPALTGTHIPDTIQQALLAQTRGAQGERMRLPWLRDARGRDPTVTPTPEPVRIGAIPEGRPRTTGPENENQINPWGRPTPGPGGTFTLVDISDLRQGRPVDPRARPQGR